MSDLTAAPDMAAKSPTRSFLAPLLLFLLAILPFTPAIAGEFTWDDGDWLVNNAAVHAWNGLHLIWNPIIQSLHFYPVVFTSFWAQHKLWGLNPIGYHAVNFLFHACSALLVWKILRRLGLRAAWLAALLWAVHPVQVDTVAWIAEQKNTLSGLFYFTSALLYLKFANIPSPVITGITATTDITPRKLHSFIIYSLSLFSFAFALLTKTVVCTLPAALFLVLWWKRGRMTWRTFLPLIPFFLLAIAPSIAASFQERSDMLVGGAENLHFSLLQRLFIAGKDVWFYLRTLVFPYPLMAIYPRWTLDYSEPLNYLAPLAVAAALATAFLLRKRLSLGPLIAFAFFLATLSPALGFINFYTMYYTFVADHYQYLACLGPLALAAEALYRLIENRKSKIENPAKAVPLAILVTALIAASLFYASLFQSQILMWSWNVQHNPRAYAAHFDLASQYALAGNLPLSRQHAAIALQLAPDDSTVQAGCGRLYLNDKKYAEAEKCFRRATEIRPTLPEPYMYLGDSLMKLHRTDEALAAYKTATDYAGNDSKPYRAYAGALLLVHRDDEALQQFAKAIWFDPGNFPIRYDYANHLLDAGRYKDSIDQYLFILQYQPNNPAVWENLAYAYHQDGQDKKALDARERAHQLETPAGERQMP